MLRLPRGDEPAADGGGFVSEPLEAEFVQAAAQYGEGVAFSLGDVHQQRGILGDMQRAGLVGKLSAIPRQLPRRATAVLFSPEETHTSPPIGAEGPAD